MKCMYECMHIGVDLKFSDIEMPVLISDFYIVHTIDPFMK